MTFVKHVPHFKTIISTRWVFTKFRSVIGSLIHLARCTRPDISETISKLSTKRNNPTIKNWKTVLNVLKYLNKTKNFFLRFNDKDDNISNPTVVKTRVWISRMNMFYNKMKRYLKNLKKISKLTGKKEDNDKVNNIISLKNSIYQSGKEKLNKNNLRLLNENGKPEGFQNNVNIMDQQSELEIDALNDCVSVISLYEEDNDQNINDGLSVEMDEEGNFKDNIDVKSIDINASSYGEALEIITDKLLNRLDFRIFIIDI